ncbi:glycosyltransferase family 4 protein [Chloroflexota bacterium]
MSIQAMTGPSMIYHYPLPIRSKPDSGSQVHIRGMLRGFERIGYKVELVTGTPGERRKALDRLKREIFEGRVFDLLFSWAPVSPMLMSRKNIKHPFLDFGFLQWCRRRSIPVGLFYGDVHWRFEHFRQRVPPGRRILMKTLYWYDWWGYLRWVDHLFLPSLRMRDVLPTSWPSDRVSELHPGCELPAPARSAGGSGPGHLELFYVGGIAPPLYDLRPMFNAIRGLDGVFLTVCCREAEWRRFRALYAPIDDSRVRIVHASGPDLAAYYARADLYGLFWEPNAYLNVTMPVKVFEALQHGVPIITAAGTVAARFVARQDIGWTVANADEFRALLERLRHQPELIEQKRRHAQTLREDCSWSHRAQQVADTLLGCDRTAFRND